MKTCNIIKVSSEINDHCATYVYVPLEYPLHGTSARNVWIYKYANYELLNKMNLSLIGHVFTKVLSMKCSYTQYEKKRKLLIIFGRLWLS